jgi:hypothetical protein
MAGPVKIYVAAMEPLKKKERQGETREPSKLMTKLRGIGAVFSCLY